MAGVIHLFEGTHDAVISGISVAEKTQSLNTLRTLGYLTAKNTLDRDSHANPLDIIADNGTIHFDSCPKINLRLGEVAGKQVLQISNDPYYTDQTIVSPQQFDTVCPE